MTSQTSTTLLLVCGPYSFTLPGADTHRLGEVPTQRELKFIDAAAREVLAQDPTPTLEEIAAQPDVAEQASPQPAPQAPFVSGRVRVIVAGNDAALSAVATRIMRADVPWVELAYVPLAPSTVATLWGLPDKPSDCVVFAVKQPALPTVMIRDDAGQVVLGQADILNAEPGQFTGEVVVDNTVVLSHQARTGLFGRPRHSGPHGVRVVPTTDAPGLAGTALHNATLDPDPTQVAVGRAAQAGGPALKVIVDGVARPRTVDKVTIYRHLRDLQAVRN